MTPQATYTSGSGRNRVFPRLALALISLVAADALAGALLLPEQDVGFRRPDAWYHHGLVPMASGSTRWGSGESYPFATNSLGCVDRSAREIALDSPNRRILFLGDSFTEGIGVPFEESFAGVLEERLARDNVEILNAAVVSFSPRLYRLRLEQLLRQEGLRVDELVVLIDMSDIQDQVLYRYFEPHVPGQMELARAAVWRRARGLSFALHTLDGYLKDRRREAKRKLYGLTDSPPWLDYFWLDNVDNEPLADPTFRRVRLDWAGEDMVDNRWAKLGIELALEDMRGVVELCREFGIRLSIAVYPWPPQIKKGELGSRQVTLWQDFCTQHDLEFVNLFGTFMSARDRSPEQICTEEFLSGDVHWNAAGHRRVADALEPWLRDGPKPLRDGARDQR